jgi:hypothetical protein
MCSWRVIVLIAAWRRSTGRGADRRRCQGVELAISFITNFFDTLGIGSATTTAAFRLIGLVPDELIPERCSSVMRCR